MTARYLAGLIVFVMAACATPSSQPPVNASGVTFLHLNDTYRVDAVEDGSRGGFGRVVTLIRELQREGREVRLLHGGDFLYPSLESQLWNGEQMIDAFNFMHALAPMVVVPGNHEFDRSRPGPLENAIAGSDFAWIVANLSLRTQKASVNAALQPHISLQSAGHSIGIFGLTLSPEDGGNSRDYLDYGGSYLDEARKSLEALSETDVVIGLTHLHLQDDQRLARLKDEFPNFDLIVGGHEHEPEHEEGSATTAEIMKGASNARAIWRIDIDFVDSGGRPRIATHLIDLDETVDEDPAYQAEVATQWRQKLLENMPFLPSRLGYAAEPFDAREVTVRNRESNWGNFVADRMRTAFGDEPPADLAFINSGTLRIDDFIAEDITFEDVARTFGFSSHLHYLTMSGAEFRQTLEAGYRGEGPSKGYFPQVSGFRVCVDRSQPDGGRIRQLQLPVMTGWREIDAASEYLVVAPEYLVGGGDGYRFPAAREPSRPGSELKYLVIDAILSAAERGERVSAPVDPQSPRIAFAPEPGSDCFARSER